MLDLQHENAAQVALETASLQVILPISHTNKP